VVTIVGAAAEMSTQRATRSASFYRTAARLAAQAAEALEHAHQLGVIHRDIKPANLMVDARGSLWVTDFGLAQFHTGVGLTRTGDLLGTLRYMSPEQAGGQRLALDPRTDVYSLGATLYELLTLEPLFDGGDHHRLLRQILYDEPRPPRAVNSAVPPELETIVLKAVGKNPSDRYASAREFADDLQRFLDNRPILARRPTLVQRASKWGRRHPSVVVAGVVLLVLLSAVSMVSAGLVRGEQMNTAAALLSERQRAEQAESRLRLAQQSVDEMIQISGELAGNPQVEGVRKRLLESALIYYQRFIEERGDDEAAQAQLEATKANVKQILDDLAAIQGDRQSHLLGDANVIADLGLTEKQQQEVAELRRRVQDQLAQSFSDFGRLSEEERQQRFLAEVHKTDEGIQQILSRQQLGRLRQIALQINGLRAFDDPDIAAELKLTAQQKERLRGIAAEAFFCKVTDGHDGRGGPGHVIIIGGRGGHGGRGPGKPGKPGKQPPEQDWRDASEKILAVLNDEQARRWKEMTGPPFKGLSEPLGPPPGGPLFGPPEPPHGPRR
jgi:hypothetical protein